jgi:alpha-N-arabinofuranosidase
MKLIRGITLFTLAITAMACGRVSAATCLDSVRVERGPANLLIADAAKVVRKLDATFFGFNVEWVEFQLGLWDSSAQRVRPEVVRLMKAFPGAVYRYPGGTKANSFNWRDAIGPVSERPRLPFVAWSPPLRAEFGPAEFLDFVQAVDGQAWYVANISGGLEGGWSSDRLALSAKGFVEHLQRGSTPSRPSILRWELGNELDRGSHKLKPDEFSRLATNVAEAIRAADGNARFVHLQQEYPAMASAGYSAARYNREVRLAMRQLNPDFALHLYYDGVPENPSVTFFLGRICEVVDAAQAEGRLGRIWITEHARVPNGFWAGTPKALWPETANLAAATSLSDMVIATAQIPQVLGTFVHSLVGSGSPWPMIHRHPNGRIEPSATLLALQILRSTLLPDLIATRQFSNSLGSEGAGYGVRSVVLADGARKKFTLWSINRSNDFQAVAFELDNAADSLRFANSQHIGGPDPKIGNHLESAPVRVESGRIEVVFTAVGRWRIVLPPNSVSAITFH